MGNMPGVIIYNSQYQNMRNLLNQVQKGELLDALMDFGCQGTVYTGTDRMVELAFALLAPTVQRSQEKYRATCERNAERARKRWDKEKNNPYEILARQYEAEELAQEEDPDADVCCGMPWLQR